MVISKIEPPHEISVINQKVHHHEDLSSFMYFHKMHLFSEQSGKNNSICILVNSISLSLHMIYSEILLTFKEQSWL